MDIAIPEHGPGWLTLLQRDYSWRQLVCHGWSCEEAPLTRRVVGAGAPPPMCSTAATPAATRGVRMRRTRHGSARMAPLTLPWHTHAGAGSSLLGAGPRRTRPHQRGELPRRSLRLTGCCARHSARSSAQSTGRCNLGQSRVASGSLGRSRARQSNRLRRAAGRLCHHGEPRLERPRLRLPGRRAEGGVQGEHGRRPQLAAGGDAERKDHLDHARPDQQGAARRVPRPVRDAPPTLPRLCSLGEVGEARLERD